MSDHKVFRHVVFWLIFAAIGGLTSLAGGPLAALKGAILSVVLAMAFPVVFRGKTARPDKPVRIAAAIGAGFGLAAGIVVFLIAWFLPDEITLFPTAPFTAIWVATLYGAAFHAIFARGEKRGWSDVKIFFLICLAMVCVNTLRLGAPAFGADNTVIFLASFGNCALFATLWTVTAIRYVGYRPPKFGKGFWDINALGIGIMLSLFGSVILGVSAPTYRGERFRVTHRSPEILADLKGTISYGKDGVFDPLTNKWSGDGQLDDFDARPETSPDGRLVAEFIERGGGAIKSRKIVVDFCSDKKRILATAAIFKPDGLCWNRESTAVYAAKTNGKLAKIGVGDVKIVELVDGDNPRLIRNTGQIAFRRDLDFYVMGPNGENPKKVREWPNDAIRRPYFDYVYDVSPDGRYFLAVAPRNDITVYVRCLLILEAKPQGKTHYLTATSQRSQPRWSP